MAKKYAPTTNQSRERKNLNETPGIELVMLVMKIHKRLMKIAIDTGCNRIFRSNLPSNNNLKINKTKIPASKGSVGKERFTGIPGINSSNRTERGVKKTAIKNNLSIETIAVNRNKNKTGKNAI